MQIFPGHEQVEQVWVLSSLGGAGPVVWGCRWGGRDAREPLAGSLLAALAGVSGRWQGCTGEGLTVETAPLGRPRILLQGRPGPPASFSYAAGRLWGAMVDRGRVGLDVAEPGEFEGGYPLDRAFGAEELKLARQVTEGETPSACALLWAVKEAAVKALGVGFNYFDPRQVEVGPLLIWERGFLLSVRAGLLMPAWVRRVGRGWLAVSWVPGLTSL